MASSNQNSPVEYGFSEDSCELPVAKSDTRTYQEKEAERIGIEYRKRIGEYSEPQSHRITFKVVGVMPDRPDSPYFEKMEDFLKNPERRETIGSNAADYVKKVHNEKDMALQIEAFYDSVLKG